MSKEKESTKQSPETQRRELNRKRDDRNGFADSAIFCATGDPKAKGKK